MANAAVAEGDQDPHVDNQSNDGQLRTGSVAEGADEFIEGLAKQAGWVPKEEWTRDPTKHVDPRTYISRLPGEMKTLQERQRRMAQVTEDALEEQRRQTRSQALAELKDAAAEKDEARVQAAERRLESTEPRPETQAWISENPWFNDDPAAQALAVSIVNREAKAGSTIREQLAAAGKEVRRRFPEHFDGEVIEQPRQEVRLSEARRPAPAVTGGTRGAATTPKVRGFADIPAGDQATFRKTFLPRYMSMKLTQEQSEQRYAASYWKNQGE